MVKYGLIDDEPYFHWLEANRREIFEGMGVEFRLETEVGRDVTFADLLALKSGETRGTFCIGWATVYYRRPFAGVRGGAHAIVIVGTSKGLFVIEPQDGTIAALQVLTVMSQSKKGLAQLLDEVRIFPQVLLNVRFKSGYDWKSDEALKKQISLVENNLKDIGRVLIRASGTEPLLRVMVETRDGAVAMSAAKSIADLVPTA